jgi:hypothetical protein
MLEMLGVEIPELAILAENRGSRASRLAERLA